jgi:CheY-like chemotaxis protein
MSKKRILLIDDESGFTNILRLSLPAFDVVAENNPVRAVETARRFKPDIIFLDVIMPDMDGGAVAAELKDDPALANVPVVFLTAIVSDKDTPSGSLIGGYEFLAKPVSRDQIVECVKKHLGP